MKREWILGLATAAGMSLLAAMPIFGGDSGVTNVKKPVADTNKPVVIVIKPAVKGDKLSAKSNNPALVMKKTTEKKEQPVRNMTTAKVNVVKPAVSVMPVANAKSMTTTKVTSNVKSSPKIQTVASSKSISDGKITVGTKTVTAAKPAVLVKPAVTTKPVVSSKATENSKPMPATTKPALKSNGKPLVKPKSVQIEQPKATVKIAANTKVIEKTKPVVISTPVVNTKPVINAKPVVASKPVINSKPVVKEQPVSNAKPARSAKSTLMSNGPQVPAPKKVTVTKPVAAKSVEKIANNPAPISRGIRIPAGWEQLNLTSEQRDKAAVIENKYASEIKKMEDMLAAAKANREKELSVLLTPQQRTQFASRNGQNSNKRMTNIRVIRPATVNGKVKPEGKKTTMIKRDNVLASAAPVSNDNSKKKGSGQK
jgi:hypothetical protein